MKIKNIKKQDSVEIIEKVVEIHLKTFKGFFLTFMGAGFLKIMYSSYVEYEGSGLLVAYDEDEVVGFLAFSEDMSGLYKYMIRKKLILFGIYSVSALIRRPQILMHLLRGFLKPSETKRVDKYVELASIGVLPNVKARGIGSQLIKDLKAKTDFSIYKYITLETDAENNEYANTFYKRNGFVCERTFLTPEGRKMNEYRYYKRGTDE